MAPNTAKLTASDNRYYVHLNTPADIRGMRHLDSSLANLPVLESNNELCAIN